MGKKTADFKTAFRQKLIRELREIPILPKRLLLAVSGGVDSTALALALSDIKALFQLELTLAYVHHGDTDHRELNQYRKNAREHVEKLSQDIGAKFLTNPVETTGLHSEKELREYRYFWLNKWKSEQDFDAIVLAHHFEDLIETQILRLIRGSSRLGLLGMTVLSPLGRLRPFLNFKKEELEKYVKSRGYEFVNDPSNKWEGALRNRIRGWLDDLEKFSPGARENLSKSLQRVVKLALESRNPWKERVLTKGGIQRGLYESLATPHKLEVLAAALNHRGVFEFTSGQLQELRKRLDVPLKETRLDFLGFSWILKSDIILITPKSNF